LFRFFKTINQDFEHDTYRFRLQLQLLPIDSDSTHSIESRMSQLLQTHHCPEHKFLSTAFVCVYSTAAELHRVGLVAQQAIQLCFPSNTNQSYATLLLATGGLTQPTEPEAEQMAHQLQALHVDASNLQPHLQPYASFERASLASSLHALIEQLQRRFDLMRWCPSISTLPSSLDPTGTSGSMSTPSEKPFLRILVCMCCGDLLPLEQLLHSFAPDSHWTRTSNRSVMVHIPLSLDISASGKPIARTQPVELLLSSFHGAQTYRDELLHGFLLLSAADRASSFTAVREFTQHIPNTPTQLIVHRIQSDFDLNDLLATALAAAEQQQYEQMSHFAESIGAHCTDFCLNRLPLSLDSFFAELIERKPHIERAFHSEADREETSSNACNTIESGVAHLTDCVPPPLPVRGKSRTLASNQSTFVPQFPGLLNAAPPKPARSTCRVRNRTGSGTSSDFRCFSASPADHRLSSSDQADTPSPLPVSCADSTLPVVSDDSDIYASVFNQKSDEHLLKPSQIRQRRAIQSGTVILVDKCLQFIVNLFNLFLLLPTQNFTKASKAVIRSINRRIDQALRLFDSSVHSRTRPLSLVHRVVPARLPVHLPPSLHRRLIEHCHRYRLIVTRRLLRCRLTRLESRSRTKAPLLVRWPICIS
jgi:hypothetical protein